MNALRVGASIFLALTLLLREGVVKMHNVDVELRSSATEKISEGQRRSKTLISLVASKFNAGV